MLENITSFFKKFFKSEQKENNSKTAAKERLHLVLMQDRANVSADFLDLMRQEIIEVIKKYINVDENEIDVRLINKANEDGTNGAPALLANIPIVSVKNSEKKNIIENKENETAKNDKESMTDIKTEDKEEIKEEKTENVEDNNVCSQEQEEKEDDKKEAGVADE